MVASETECKHKNIGGAISMIVPPILTMVGIAVVSLFGWLLYTTYSQAQELSEIKRDSTYYLQQIEKNTNSIEKLSGDFNKLSAEFKDLRLEVNQFNLQLTAQYIEILKSLRNLPVKNNNSSTVDE